MQIRLLPCLALALTLHGLTSCAALENLVQYNDRRGITIDGKQEGRWIYFHDNREKKAEGSYRDDRQVGPWTYWYANGNKEWEGSFANERLDGPCSAWYEDGSPRAKGVFVAGEEEGVWTHWKPGSVLDQTGEYADGRRTLRWKYLNPEGELCAEGYYLNGERVGLWRFWERDGRTYETAYPLPNGYELVRENWPDGSARREGFLRQGRPVGRWVTWHQGGGRRLVGQFVNGSAKGRFMTWRADGELLAAGPVDGKRASGTWSLWAGGRETTMDAASIPAFPPIGDWSVDGVTASRSPESVVSTWIAEALSPIDASAPLTASGPEPTARMLEVVAIEPSVPVRAQPWTETERESLDYLKALYSDGAKTAQPPAGGRYARRGKKKQSLGAVEISEPLIGKPLPWKELRGSTGDAFDLDQYKGKKVLLVILRGFAGQVCVYCVTQVDALSQYTEDFERMDTVVLVAYPGDRGDLEAFVASYESVTKQQGDPPYVMSYDPGFDLVDNLGIRSKLARPTTIILDEQGIVRYAFIGKSSEDRPPAEDLIEALEGMPTATP